MHPDSEIIHRRKSHHMTLREIRAELRTMDAKAERLKPCGLSFNEVMKDLTQK